LGHIPQAGETVRYGGRLFTVEVMEGHRIQRIRVEESPVALHKPGGGS
jgi:CBS domain containing-hemolysin-like protein